MELIPSIRAAWRTGGGARSLLVICALFALTGLVSTGVSIYLNAERAAHPPNPLQSPSPEQIPDKKAAYRVGDTFNVLGAKCNKSNETIVIRGESWWQNMDQGAEGTKIPSGANSVTGRALPPGCMPLNFPHKIPPGVTPGRWAFVGNDCIYPGPSFCAPWFSETFTVVP